jgi:hypothetical protein
VKEEPDKEQVEEAKGGSADAEDESDDEEPEREPKTVDGGEMPKTASPGPLAALVGGLMSVLGFGISRIRR